MFSTIISGWRSWRVPLYGTVIAGLLFGARFTSNPGSQCHAAAKKGGGAHPHPHPKPKGKAAQNKRHGPKRQKAQHHSAKKQRHKVRREPPKPHGHSDKNRPHHHHHGWGDYWGNDYDGPDGDDGPDGVDTTDTTPSAGTSSWRMTGEYPLIAGRWAEAEKKGIFVTVQQHGNKFVADCTYKTDKGVEVHWRANGTISKNGEITARVVHTRPVGFKPQTRTGTLDQDGNTLHGHAAWDNGGHDFTWKLKEPYGAGP